MSVVIGKERMVDRAKNLKVNVMRLAEEIHETVSEVAEAAEPEPPTPNVPVTSAHIIPDSLLEPVHHRQLSLLSSTSHDTDLSGFLNLVLILLFLANLRPIVSSVITYGVLVTLEPMRIVSFKEWPGVMMYISMQVFPVMAFVIEKLAYSRLVGDVATASLHAINVASCAIMTIMSIFMHDCYFSTSIADMLLIVTNFVILCTMVIYMMKLSSFAHTSYVFRLELRRRHAALFDEKGAVRHVDTSEEDLPDLSLSLTHVTYFMVAPTLVYQASYPRTSRIRVRYLMREIFRMIFTTGVWLALAQQGLIPATKSAILPMEKLDIVTFSERFLQMCLPSMYLWILFFYIFFHTYLNVLAEITRFADRGFYRDWWNSTTYAEFWRKWNLPVHYFMARHVYRPLKSMGMSQNLSGIIVFFLSAVAHEAAFSIAFKTIRPYAFIAMMMQVPMSYLTEKYTKGRQFGNVVFWVMLLFGQPLAVLLYFRDTMISP